MLSSNDYYVAHEYLEPFNDPVYVHEFIKRANDQGCAYIGMYFFHDLHKLVTGGYSR